MKNIRKLIAIPLLLALLINCFAQSHMAIAAQTKDIDNALALIEKTLLASEVQEKELSGYIRNGIAYAEETPKISKKQINAAVKKKLNEIKVYIEIAEEKYGGLSKEEYKMIADQLIYQMYGTTPLIYWKDKKTVEVRYKIDPYFTGLVGNLKRNGKADNINTDTKVAEAITGYFTQAIEKGNKINANIQKVLPDKAEKLLKEYTVSEIETARIIAGIHQRIYENTKDYNGSETITDILASYRYSIESTIENREKEKLYEEYVYPSDSPSKANYDELTRMIVDGELDEEFIFDFDKVITLEQLARLYFERDDFYDEEEMEKVEIEDGFIPNDLPPYIRYAYIFGMIESESDLKKPLTRLEAAKALINIRGHHANAPYVSIPVADYKKISMEDYQVIGGVLSFMSKGINFNPSSPYLREDAIINSIGFYKYDLRIRDLVPINISDTAKIIIGKDTIDIRFEDTDQIMDYIDDYLYYPQIEKLNIKKKYTRIDMGYALLEMFTPENGLKFTFKKGIEDINFELGAYGPDLIYHMDPKILKTDDKIDMNMKMDPTTKKVFDRLDTINKKIIKKGMTEKQKIKAIHDYVVKYITYDIDYSADYYPVGLEGLLITLDKKRGVCDDYARFFQYLCLRAKIPCTYEAGNLKTIYHAWNAVYIDGEWKFVDATGDDYKGVIYSYYLKDAPCFFRDRIPVMGCPDEDLYTEIDPMKIKSQAELRAYIFQRARYPVTIFRISSKKMKPDLHFMSHLTESKSEYNLKYDSKKDLYTLIINRRKYSVN